MGKLAEIVCWLPLLTSHQGDTLLALAQAAGAPITFRVLQEESAERKAQGWARYSCERGAVVQLQRPMLLSALKTVFARASAVHVFGSPFERPVLILTLMAALLLNRRVYLISEPYSPISRGYLGDGQKLRNWLRSKLRPMVYRLYGALIHRRVSGVFAISPLAVEQYRDIGVPKEKIFPFGYFLKPGPVAVPEKTDDDTLRIVYVGSLIERKGLSDLMAAMRMLEASNPSMRLDVYGPGDPGKYAFDGHRMRYCGLLPFGSAPETMSRYDVMVLPSHYDGWGVVVNEAIAAGVPVAVSAAVGASAVVLKWGCGVLFEAGNIRELSDVLKGLSLDRARLAGMRLAAARLAPLLASEVAGRYLHDVIVSGGPVKCPWYDVGG